MTKRRKKAKQDKSRKVTCFFFHGDVSKLGDELSKALKEAGLAEIIENLSKNASVNYTPSEN